MRHMKLNVIWLSIFLASCCSDYVIENNDTVFLTKTDSGYYELLLKGVRCVGGHDPISVVFKSKTEILHYLYTTKRIGTLYPKDFIVSYEQGKLDYPHTFLNVKGTVELRSRDVVIKLAIPHYNNSGEIENYVSYEFNGEYKLSESRGISGRS